MTVSVVKRQFNAGELSPKVFGRTDLDKWQAGCRTLLNFVPLPQGGAQRRPGWEYITTSKAATVRLIPFIFSNTQAYVLEFTDKVMRVFMKGGIVLSGGVTYEMVTTYAAADLGALQFCQSYDTLIITHPGYAPAKITRTAHDSWTIADIVFTAPPAEWGAADYPRTCCFYQDRLVFASSPSYPSRIWASKTSDYYNLTTGTNDADGLSLNLLSGQSDTIYWLASAKALLAGLDTGLMMITSATGADGALTPTSKKATKAQQYGAANVMPVAAGNNILHVAYPGTKLREVAFSWENDGFVSNEVSILSEHILSAHPAYQLAYQASPFEIIWIRLSDGTFAALTYLVEHKVVGWSRHSTPAQGAVLSIATIPGTYETELWAAIYRVINGSPVVYIERMGEFGFEDMDDAFFVDCGLSYSGAAISTVTGLSHLEGEFVSYKADGVKGTATVSGGQITLPAAASNIHVGLAYNSDFEPLTPEPDLQGGATTFHIKRITEVGFMVRQSAGGKFGPDENYLTTLLPDATLVSQLLPLQSLRGGHGESRSVFVRQSDPYPINIDLVGYELEVE